jgi:hypothetical protein
MVTTWPWLVSGASAEQPGGQGQGQDSQMSPLRAHQDRGDQARHVGLEETPLRLLWNVSAERYLKAICEGHAGTWAKYGAELRQGMPWLRGEAPGMRGR